MSAPRNVRKVLVTGAAGYQAGFVIERVSLDGKVVLITGASRGVGRAAAEAFLRAGAHVVATGRDREAARSRLRAAQ